jgi:hypothetical protein
MEKMINSIPKADVLTSASHDHKPMLSEAVFRPMLFSTPMVRALLDGRKTQTRRIVKDVLLQKYKDTDYDDFLKVSMLDSKKPKIGEIIWVRETFSQKDDRLIYRSQVCSKYDLPDGFKWKPSLFMPKSVCRLFLEIINVRLERLNDISEFDSISEGIEIIERPKSTPMFKDYNLKGTMLGKNCPVESYQSLWSSINGQNSWNENPYVWVYDFKLVERPHGFR